MPALPTLADQDLFQKVDDAIAGLKAHFDAVRHTKSPDELRRIAARFGAQINALYDLQDESYSDILPHNLEQLESWIAQITHEEAPAIGQDFLARRNATGTTRKIDSSQGALAVYSSYRLGDDARFINELSLNPRKISVGEDYVFYGTDNHEIFHALQTGAAPILKHTPWNAQTTAFLHPEAWVRMVENLAERDANARESLFYVLLARARPALRDKLLDFTKNKLIPMAAMETIMADAGSLQEAMTQAAVMALDANTRRGFHHGRTYTDNYHGVAMSNYWNGLVSRANAGTKGIVYFRPEAKDLWEIGNYHVGPNALGTDTLDPRFEFKIPRIDVAEDLQVLCERNGIPPLDECMTYSQYLETQTADMSQDHTAFSVSHPAPGLQPMQYLR